MGYYNHSGLSGTSAFISGSDALFKNPANLNINSYRHGNDITFGMLQFYGNDVISDISESPLSYFKDSFLNRFSTIDSLEIFNNQSNFLPFYTKDKFRISESRLEFRPLTFKLKWDTFSLGLGIRHVTQFESKVSSKFWYQDLIPNDSTENRSIEFYGISYNELRLGLSTELSYLNNLTSSLSKYYFGITASLLYSGGFVEHQTDQFLQYNSADQTLKSFTRFRHSNTGLFSLSRTEEKFDKNYSNQFIEDLQVKNGIGGAISMGITYIIPIGDDLSLLKSNRNSLKKSMRFSVVLEDFGFIHFKESDNYIYTSPDTLKITSLEENKFRSDFFYSESEIGFTPGDLNRFIQTIGDTLTYYEQSNKNNESYNYVLPSRLTLGWAGQYNWWSLMADLSINLKHIKDYGLYNYRVSVGSEFNLIPFLPLRAGYSYQLNQSHIFTAGMGIELGFFVVQTGVLYHLNERESFELNKYNGMGFTALKIRF